MLRQTTIAILFTAGTLIAAPVPRLKTKPPAVPEAGEYVLTWASIQCRVTLIKDGRYRSEWGGKPWGGTWHWEAKTRTLHVHESADGQTWSSWSVQLNDELAGGAEFGPSRAHVTLKVVKENKTAAEGLADARTVR